MIRIYKKKLSDNSIMDISINCNEIKTYYYFV